MFGLRLYIPVNNFSVMSGCVCENIHHLCMREKLIFLWAFGHMWKEKNNDEHFLLACRKGSYNILPRKSIGALIEGGGTLKDENVAC